MATYSEIAQMIDHSLLKPQLDSKTIADGCNIALEYEVASVCVRPCDVQLAYEIINRSSVKVSTVIGFPHGSTTTATKLFETNEALENGAVELDMVLNISKLKSGEYKYVGDEIRSVVEAAHSSDAIVKVIFENCYLSDPEKIEVCKICNDTGVDYAKTSTGYGSGGATDEDIKLMRQYCADSIKIKAAGGIRTLERALQVRELGCSRIGATATVDILSRLK
ncbi:deoxyribose-phosphate aldolase [Chitinispirillales bacterium ANBcel5]|uniref:deoxyribose-phosphate aldolase n=1 Tax=Cellulosispirillum alkaliphilum TaxID=3039283 RepID=UPI002A5266D9|nr:deoxyribose-phosphate aldolase [Chitinispirillales bacterium ANBcel5]